MIAQTMIMSFTDYATVEYVRKSTEKDEYATNLNYTSYVFATCLFLWTLS